MPTYVYRDGKVVEKQYEPTVFGPQVISDTMTETRHMMDGRYYTSKSKYRAATKAHGCIEVGNDSSFGKARKPIPLSREKRREDIKRTIYNMRNGIRE